MPLTGMVSDAGRAQRALVVVLRWTGAVSGLAVVAAFMPLSWIAAAHEALGLGPLPDGPVVEYLARSTSFLYAGLGALLWLIAADPVRHAPILRFILAAGFTASVGLFILDRHAGLPPWWRAAEGPAVFFICSLLAFLAGRAGLLSKSPPPA